MKIVDRKKMIEEVVSKINSVPTGVDWRLIRLRRQKINIDNEKPSRVDYKTTMAASL